jgi:ribonuclease R
VAAAKLLLRKKQPSLYRIHEGPAEEKLTDLREFLGELGLSLSGGKKPQAGDYAQLLEQISDRPDRHLIQTVLLRSLSQAVYSSDNVGHFGLSYQAYTHFTSPIRRYPDLIVHRALKHIIDGGSADDFDYTKADLQGLGEHCSSTERKADEATRDALDWLKCEYMQDKVGETFNGIITSVNSFGVFVELENIYVDGLVHITALDNDYYHYDPVGHRLTGERTGKVLRLGDPITIKVANVNLDDRKIDFLPVGEIGVGRKRGRSRKSEKKPATDKTRNTGKGSAASKKKRRRSRTKSSG